MKIRFVIPHYFDRSEADPTPERYGSTTTKRLTERTAVLHQTVHRIHHHFGSGQSMIDIAGQSLHRANNAGSLQLDIVVIHVADQHLIDEAGIRNDVRAEEVNVAPRHLGFAAHQVLASGESDFDFCVYLEDDIWLNDPATFQKLTWFSQMTSHHHLMQPHRFEVRDHGTIRKCYIDGNLSPKATAGIMRDDSPPTISGQVLGRPIEWVRPSNPHSGCFFLSAEQVKIWKQSESFGGQDDSFVGPLESAATLSIAKTFRIYKPSMDSASFFEVEHGDRRFIHPLP